MHAPRRRMSAVTLLIILGFVLGLGGLALAATKTDPTPALTAGAVPKDATRSDGSVDLNKTPDLISVSDNQSKVVGYAYATDIFPSGVVSARPDTVKQQTSSGIISVWDKTGKTLVGHLYPNGAGFVSRQQESRRGISANSPPAPTMTPTTVLSN